MDLIIGIPTFNRPNKALNLILKLEKFIDNTTEIFVIENYSENMIDKNKLSHLKTKYIGRSNNLGLDQSIIDLAYYAQQKKSKLWFLCDDDDIYFDNFPNILNEIKMSKNEVIFVPWENIKGTYKDLNKSECYLRMSFLPCIAIDPKRINLTDLNPLLNSSYIHIAIINQLLDSVDDIGIIKSIAGKQSQNKSTRFEIFNTFAKGYQKCLTYKPIISENKMNKLIFDMTYSSINYYKSTSINKKAFIDFLIFCVKINNISIIYKIRFCIKLLSIRFI